MLLKKEEKEKAEQEGMQRGAAAKASRMEGAMREVGWATAEEQATLAFAKLQLLARSAAVKRVCLSGSPQLEGSWQGLDGQREEEQHLGLAVKVVITTMEVAAPWFAAPPEARLEASAEASATRAGTVAEDRRSAKAACWVAAARLQRPSLEAGWEAGREAEGKVTEKQWASGSPHALPTARAATLLTAVEAAVPATALCPVEAPVLLRGCAAEAAAGATSRTACPEAAEEPAPWSL